MTQHFVLFPNLVEKYVLNFTLANVLRLDAFPEFLLHKPTSVETRENAIARFFVGPLTRALIKRPKPSFGGNHPVFYQQIKYVALSDNPFTRHLFFLPQSGNSYHNYYIQVQGDLYRESTADYEAEKLLDSGEPYPYKFLGSRLRLPNHIFEYLKDENPAKEHNSDIRVLLIPESPRLSNQLSYVLDWLQSSRAPLSIEKLDPWYAINEANNWHDELQRDQRGNNLRLQSELVRRMAARADAYFLHLADRDNVDKLAAQLVLTEQDFTLIWARHNYYIVALESKESFQYESYKAGHCIGRTDRYWSMKKSDPYNYVAMSLRKRTDQGEEILATFDYFRNEHEGFTQLKGPSNKKLTAEAGFAFLVFLEDIARFPIAYRVNESQGLIINSVTKEGKFHGTRSEIANYMGIHRILDLCVTSNPVEKLLRSRPTIDELTMLLRPSRPAEFINIEVRVQR